jgi:putative FmdB family regulatory protein
MPIYEYRCAKGHTVEVMQRMGDAPLATCEVCALPVQRVFHPIAVHFKGKGFYNTDYGTRKGEREKAAAAKGSSSSSSDSSSSDSKSGDVKSGESKSSDSKSADSGSSNGAKPADKKSAAKRKTEPAGR